MVNNILSKLFFNKNLFIFIIALGILGVLPSFAGALTVPTGTHPVTVVASADGNYVYVISKTSNALQKFNATTGLSLEKTVMTNHPVFMAISPDDKYLYVVSYDINSVIRKYDASDLSLLLSASVNSVFDASTFGSDVPAIVVAVSPDGNRVYVFNANTTSALQEFNAVDLTEVTSVNIGTSFSNGGSLAVSPDSQFVYLGNFHQGDNFGTLHKLNALTLSQLVVRNAAGLNSIPYLTTSPDGNNVYVVYRPFNRLDKLNSSDLTQIITAPTGGASQSVAISPDNSNVYLVTYVNNFLRRYDSNFTSFTSTSTSSGGSPLSVAVSAGKLNCVYVVNSQSNTLQGFNPLTLADATRCDGLNPLPTLISVAPNTAVAGSADQVITLTGTGFIPASITSINGTPTTTTFVNSTTLTAVVPASDIVSPGTLSLAVVNPLPGGGTSNSLPFIVTPAPNPLPTLTSINPNQATEGDPDLTITLTGTGFIPSSQVNFSGTPIATTYISDTHLTAVILGFNMTNSGTFAITVFNPAPGGGTSNSLPFTVSPVNPAPNPIPTLTLINPDRAVAGSTNTVITLTGTNFIPSSQAQVNGANIATTYSGSSTSLTAIIPAANMTTTGTLNIGVINPGPGGGTSNLLPFAVNNPIPVLTSINPNAATQNDPGLTMTLMGTNFIPTSAVNFNNLAITTTYINATTLTAFVPSLSLTVVGTFNVEVVNPAPGGGTSNSLPFTVTIAQNPIPTLVAVSPNTAIVGSPDQIVTLTGTNFIPTSEVNVSGTVLPAGNITFVSPTSLIAVIPASNLVNIGTFQITVTNPAPGGGTTAPVTFTVQNPVPVLTSVAPNSATEGDSDLPVTLTGTGFVLGVVANFNGTGLVPTTFISSTSLTATIPAVNLATAGLFPITVTNPGPGGGISNSLPFTVNSGSGGGIPNPLPILILINPNTAVIGSPDQIITLSGVNFIPTSVVQVNGALIATTFVNSTTLTAIIPASNLSSVNTMSINVFNPTPGGGASNVLPFTVTPAPNPIPTLISVNPNTATVGDPALLATFTGTNFIPTSVVNSNGSSLSTTYISATQLTATIPAASMTSPQTLSLTVTNPTPGGGTSNSLPFTVNSTGGGGSTPNPIPTLTSISPNTATQGDSNTTITLTGTNFISTSVVNFGSGVLATTYVGPASLTAVIPAVNLTTVGTTQITVTNPAPGGGTSNSLPFTVVAPTSGGGGNTFTGGGGGGASIIILNNSVPTITLINPDNATKGDPGFVMTITGTNFIPTSTVIINGVQIPTTYISSTQLNSQVPSSVNAGTGTFPVTVTNPAPGGGASNTVSFTVHDQNDSSGAVFGPNTGSNGSPDQFPGFPDTGTINQNTSLLLNFLMVILVFAMVIPLALLTFL